MGPHMDLGVLEPNTYLLRLAVCSLPCRLRDVLRGRRGVVAPDAMEAAPGERERVRRGDTLLLGEVARPGDWAGGGLTERGRRNQGV